MNLDLSALDVPETPIVDGAGTVKRAPLDQFEPDPVQLARERDEAADDRDREDIKLRGVMQPIVVAAEPTPSGKLLIRTGHRRWRLSGEAGLPDAPYIHEIPGVTYDAYAQLAENRKRKNESPMDIALAIVAAKARGDKNSYIATQIGIDKSEVTHHLVLIEGPEYIRALYTDRRCRSPKYLYDLSNLAKEFPDEVRQFCATSDDFSRKAITAFAESLKNPAPVQTTQAQTAFVGNTNESAASTLSGSAEPNAGSSVLKPAGGPVTGQSAPAVDNGPVGNTNAAAATLDESGNDQVASSNQTSPAAEPPVHVVPGHNPAIEKEPTAPQPPDPSKIKKPLLLATYNGRDVMVMLYRRPTTPGLAFVKFEDGSGEEEVEFGQLVNLTLTESQV